MNLRNLIFHTASLYGQEIAFQIKKKNSYHKLTFAQVKEKILALASHLIDLGIKKGDRVVILSENRPEWPISYLAITSIGAVAVPLDIMLSKEEIRPLVSHCGANAIILSKRGMDSLQEKIVKLEIGMDEIDNFKLSGLKLDDIPLLDNVLAAILYTSGTTGKSKGVMLTHNNIMSNVLAVAQIFQVGPGDNFLSVLPLHHTFESTSGFLAPFYMGCSITYAQSLKSYQLLRNMQETGVTIMCGVPLLYQLFYDGVMRAIGEKPWIVRLFARFAVRKKFGGKIKFWVSGGAALDPAVIEGFRKFGITILQGYGLTESAPILSCNTLTNNKIGSVGKVLPGVEVKIEPRHGVAIQEGEVLARGPNIMQGYYKSPDLTGQVLEDGWLYTGDIGRFDEEGYLYITGRSKDVIVTGSGVNVYPDEIEFQIRKLQGVADACVIGSKIKKGIRSGMEEVWSIIVPDMEYFKRMNVESSDVIDRTVKNNVFALNEELAEYKRIANVIVRYEDFPKTTTRKVKKYQLKKEMGLL